MKSIGGTKELRGTSMLELYYFHGATCGLKTRFTMAEKGEDYTPRVLTRGDLKSPEYLKLNPNAEVPTLVHEDAVVVESSIIMRYIDDVADGPALRPSAPLDRVRMGMWMKLADENYLPALSTVTYTIGHRHRIMAEHEDDVDAYLAGIPHPVRRERRRRLLNDGFDSPDFTAALETLDGMLIKMEAELTESAYLADGRYTLADAAITPFVERLREFGLDDMWERGRHDVCDWWDRIRTRGSYDDVLGTTPNPEAPMYAEKAGAVREILQDHLARIWG